MPSIVNTHLQLLQVSAHQISAEVAPMSLKIPMIAIQTHGCGRTSRKTLVQSDHLGKNMVQCETSPNCMTVATQVWSQKDMRPTAANVKQSICQDPGQKKETPIAVQGMKNHLFFIRVKRNWRNFLDLEGEVYHSFFMFRFKGPLQVPLFECFLSFLD